MRAIFLFCDVWPCQLSACMSRIVAILERHGILKIANVGDCGLKVIREGNMQSLCLSILAYLPLFQFGSPVVQIALNSRSVYRPSSFFHISTRTLLWLSLPTKLRGSWTNISGRNGMMTLVANFSTFDQPCYQPISAHDSLHFNAAWVSFWDPCLNAWGLFLYSY